MERKTVLASLSSRSTNSKKTKTHSHCFRSGLPVKYFGLRPCQSQRNFGIGPGLLQLESRSTRLNGFLFGGAPSPQDTGRPRRKSVSGLPLSKEAPRLSPGCIIWLCSTLQFRGAGAGTHEILPGQPINCRDHVKDG
ncbi:unnamed protein product, partial [Mesorhabditis spiculigera]